MSQPLPRFTKQTAIPTTTSHQRKPLRTPIAETRTASNTAGGDWRALRGIPVIARGVGGTSPGTNPLNAILSKQG